MTVPSFFEWFGKWAAGAAAGALLGLFTIAVTQAITWQIAKGTLIESNQELIESNQELIATNQSRMREFERTAYIDLNRLRETTHRALDLIMDGSLERAAGVIESINRDFVVSASNRTASPGSVSLFGGGGREIDLAGYLASGDSPIVFDSLTGAQWHPTKPRLIFTGFAEGSPAADLFVYDFVLQRLKQLTRTPGQSERQAKWSPDGERIVFARDNERGQVTVLTRPVSEQDVRSESAITGHNPVEIVGGDEDGPFYQAFYPVYSAFDGWVMVTAEDKTKEEYHLYMISTDPGLNLEPVLLTTEKDWFQCKGNWKTTTDGRAFLVYNEFDEADGFYARIVRTLVESSGTDEDPAFTLHDVEYVTQDVSENEAPEFANSIDRIVFSTRESRNGNRVLRLSIRGGELGDELWSMDPAVIMGESGVSYHFPDWRSAITREVLESYSGDLASQGHEH